MEKYTGLEIAIIGMAGRFPEADNITQYWDNLQNGKDCISDFTEEEIILEGEPETLVKSSAYVKSNAYIKTKKYFDSEFFGYTPHEAELMDPQVRIYHECCWEALEDSGYTFSANDKVGVFSAASPSVAWQLFSTKNNQDNFVDGFTASHLRDATFLSSRISYKFNLKGPAILVHTACSSSLVSIHQACSSLLLGECNIAVAGGVNIVNYSKKGYLYQEGMIHSKDGRCRPFDADSSGTVGGEGAGVVILKRLKDAIKDRDNIYAIVKGSAINNDGSNKVGYTAPSVKGQAEVIRKAHKMARIEQSTIGYIETHGTATSLGDSIEVEALNEVFGSSALNTCAIGSVKSNIGHLDTAAGVAGFIKAVLAIKNKKIPASLHFEQPNPRVDFKGGPFYVNNKLKDWNGNEPLRAGVSSFGIGGTNAHIVLQEAPEALASSESRKKKLLVLSAKTSNSLNENIIRLNEFLKNNKNINLADTAFSLQKGRERFKYRKTVICNDIEDASDKLEESLSYNDVEAHAKEDIQNIIFMFPGQGTQYSDMCKDLYHSEKIFRNKVDECFAIASQYSSEDFSSILFPDGASGKNINNTEVAQPLLFIIEYALAHLLQQWGIKPDYMVGHSIGEYVAACVSGVFTLNDAIRLVIKRGELMGKAEKGSMLSIEIESDKLNLPSGIDIAVINSEKSIVVSGTDQDIEEFSNELGRKGIINKKIHTSHAFHSYMMDSILDEFEKEFSHISIQKSQIPYISNITGDFVDDHQISQPSYWSRHLRNTVNFFKGTETLLKTGGACFIEVGPGRSLSNYVSDSSSMDESHVIINMVRHAKQSIDDQEYILGKLGSLWEHGVNINWDQFYNEEERNKVSLPTYAFEKLEYVTDFNLNRLLNTQLKQDNFSESFTNIEEYINVPYWKRSVLPNKAVELSESSSTFLVFSGDKEKFSDSIIKNLRSYGQNVIEIQKGEGFSEVNQNTFKLNIGSSEEVSELWKHFRQKEIIPDHIIYCLTLDEEYQKGNYDTIDKKINDGYLGLCNIAQSIAGSGQSGKISISVVGNYLAQVTQQDEVDALKAMIYSPVQIIPSEISNVRCKIIDIPYPFQNNNEDDEYILKIENEVFYEASESPCVAYRYNERWVQTYEQLQHNPKTDSDVKITEKGVYLIIGGTGGIGLSIAEKLAENYSADIILVQRSEFPEKKDWNDLLNSEKTDETLRRKIQKIKDIENYGSQVKLYRSDITDEKQVQELTLKIKNDYPSVNGILWGAGEVDYGGIILNRAKEDFISYSSAKVHGLLLLEKYFDFSQLDFLALFSSVGNAIYQVKFGQIAYNAGNEFLENYAYAARKSGINAITINWCDWFDTGLTYDSVRKAENIQDSDLINSKIHNGIYPEKGIKIFFKCLQNKGTVYTIYPQDLNRNIDQQRKKLENTRQEIFSLMPQNQEEGLVNSEEILVDLFSAFFGKKVSRENNFFELGGDSLKAMNLIARINQKISSNLTISDIYKFPTVKELTEMLGDLNPSSQDNRIPQAPVQKYYKTSAEQKRMYFLQAIDEQSTLYNETEVLRIFGKIDQLKVENIFKKIITRHESLRTSLTVVDGELMQEILTDFSFRMEILPYEENREHETIQSFVRPFDLQNAPLLRVGLIEKNSEECLMVIDSHHIVLDGVSRFVLREEFNILYNGGEPETMVLQYKDYAEWQNTPSQREKLDSQKKFWINEFSEEVHPLELPIDFPRPFERTNEGDFVKFIIEKEDSGTLRKMASEAGGTMYTVLLAVLNIFLGKLGNQEDVVIGTPVSGRQDADLENLIGMFVNTVCLRNYPKGENTFRDFLSEVKEKTLISLENQSYQFEELVNDLKIERDERRNPLFDTMFVYQNYEESKQVTNGLVIKPENFKINFSRFDLTLLVIDENEELHLRLIYSTEIFKRETAERFVNYFREIIKQVTENQAVTLSEITIIPAEEKQKLLVDFNNTAVEYPGEKNVLDLFLRNVEKIPDATALIHGDEKVSFSELNEKADAIAFKINTKLEGTGHKIGLIFKQSVEMIATILAVIKSGNTYIPLSPEDPAERKKYILEDCEADILMIQDILKGENQGIISEEKILVVQPNEEKEITEQYPKVTVSSESLLYIIYTSGTTGKPKGVEIRHRNLVNYALWNIDCHNLSSNDVGLQLLSYHFDGFCHTFYASLLSGAAMVTLPAESRMNTHYIADVIVKHEVTFFGLLPALYSTILDEFASKDIKTALRFVVLAGEKTSKSLLSKSKKIFPDVHLENEYGPTEATVGCIHNQNLSENNVSLIGKPISNTSVYILGDHQQLLPIGVSGEICISGEGVAKGYVNNSLLTSERFIKNPYSSHEAMYRTGDVGKWHSDGTIEILQRIDDQIKIRGYRVELEEIAGEIMNYGSVSKCVVLPIYKNGTPQLTAYFTSETEINTDDLQSFLALRIPDYMIPVFYVRMDEFPYTINGKLDKRALPEPIEQDFDKAEPKTEKERLILDIWRQVLVSDEIGVTDNFFSVGGDSIKSIQVSSRLRAKGYEASVKDILKSKNIRALADKLNIVKTKSDQGEIVGEIPLSPIQKWFFSDTGPEENYFNQSVMINFPEGIAKETVETIFNALQVHHDALRMTYSVENGSISQRANPASGFPVSLKEFNLKGEENREEILLSESQKIQSSIDLKNGPLVNLGLFHMNNGSRLLIVIHHLVIDGVSWRILFEDIETLYQQNLKNEKFVLPLKTDSFKSWIENLKAYKQTKNYKEGSLYWNNILQKPVKQITRDYPEGSNLYKTKATEVFNLDKEITSKLLTEVHFPFNTQINDILLTAFLLSVEKVYEQDHIFLDLESHGRHSLGQNEIVDRTVGWFTGFYPVLLEKENIGTAAIIKNVKETLRNIPNQGIDYILKKYYSEAETENHSENTPRISFNYLGQFDAEFDKSSFGIANEEKGEDISGNKRREYDWDISGIITDGKLSLSIVYGKEQYTPETIQKLMSSYQEKIFEIVEYCCNYQKREITPSDLSIKNISQQYLSDLQEKYNIQNIYSLSPMQEGILFHSVYEPGSTSYFGQMTFEIEKELDFENFEESVNELVARHDIFRTVFLHEVYDKPLQLLLKNRTVKVELNDVRNEMQHTRIPEITEKYKELEKNKGFDLQSDILMRFRILQVKENHYAIIWSYHHILMDGWCTAVILDEFRQIYSKKIRKQPLQLSPVNPYLNYIQWFESRDKTDSEIYWKEKLSDYTYAVSMPKKDLFEDEKLEYVYDSKSSLISTEDAEILNEMASQYGITLNTIIQFAWGMLLAKYNGTDDVVFGTVVSGRPSDIQGIESMIGLFINTIPVRIKYSSEDNLENILQKIQADAIETNDHQYHPLSEIQVLSPLGRNLLDHIVIVENYPVLDESDISENAVNCRHDFPVKNVEMYVESNYDLMLVVSPHKEIEVKLEYNSSVYDPETIETILVHFNQIIQQVVLQNVKQQTV
nr:non-ribosomal peptide synthetase/type I polyketide synthase [uncultured Chryseobacterium sp.]